MHFDSFFALKKTYRTDLLIQNVLGISDEYLKSIFSQIFESYKIISNLQDSPGDLETIKKEILKITGQLQVVVNKLEEMDDYSDKAIKLLVVSKNYLDSYDFSNEIETMSKLYSNDSDRLRNLRLKIIESLNDKKLLEKIESILNS